MNDDNPHDEAVKELNSHESKYRSRFAWNKERVVLADLHRKETNELNRKTQE
jgi:hypothetical protein